MEEEFYNWQEGMEKELEVARLSILTESIENGLMLTFLSHSEETNCKLRLSDSKGWELESKSKEADWVNLVAENIQAMGRSDFPKILSLLVENGYGIYPKEGHPNNNTQQYEEEKEFLALEVGEAIIERRVSESSIIYIKEFEQSIIYNHTELAINYIHTDKEFEYFCAVSILPEILVIRLQIDLNFLDITQAIIDNLGFNVDLVVNILLEYKTDKYSILNGESRSLSEVINKGQIQTECNQEGVQDIFGCKYIVRIVNKYFEYYTKYSALLQKMPKIQEFLNIMKLVYLNALGAEDDQIVEILISNPNNLQNILNHLSLESSEYLPLYINELTDQKTNEQNIIINILLYIRHILSNTENYCIICLGRLGNGGSRLSPCSSQFCQFSFEESYGELYSEIVSNPQMINLDLSLASNALASIRAPDVFEPFPTFFLKEREIREKAGFLTNKTKHVDNTNKKINLLREFFGKFPDLGLLLECCQNETAVKALFNTIYGGSDNPYDGMTAYKLMRYVVATNRLQLLPLLGLDKIKGLSSDILQFIVTGHASEVEEKFNLRKKFRGSVYLFHGSSPENWYSILRNGLKNLSHSHMMTAGAARGAGIYASSMMQTSIGFSMSKSSSIMQTGRMGEAPWKWKHGKYLNHLVMAIVEVNSKFFDRSVAVIPKDEDVIIRYLLLIPPAARINNMRGMGLTSPPNISGINNCTTDMNLEEHYTSFLVGIKFKKEEELQSRRAEAIKLRKQRKKVEEKDSEENKEELERPPCIHPFNKE